VTTFHKPTPLAPLINSSHGPTWATTKQIEKAATQSRRPKQNHCFGSGSKDAVSTLIVAASALATPFT
jgi:hypothetical protein